MNQPSMLQNELDRDHLYPWRVLVACKLMNLTTAAQARPVVMDVFEQWPTPSALATASGQLEYTVKPLGLMNTRSKALRRLSQDYVDGVPPEECYGSGPYAKDSIAVFVHGRHDLWPDDGPLNAYVRWMREQHR